MDIKGYYLSACNFIYLLKSTSPTWKLRFGIFPPKMLKDGACQAFLGTELHSWGITIKKACSLVEENVTSTTDGTQYKEGPP